MSTAHVCGSHALDQITHLAARGRAARRLAVSRTPCPKPAESPAVPAHDGFWLHDNQVLAPARPDPRQRDPEEALRMSQAQARVAVFEDRKLLTQGQVFKDKVATGAES